MQGARPYGGLHKGYRAMNRSNSIRLLIAASSVLIALARVAPADVVATTFDSANLRNGAGVILLADASHQFYRP